MSVKLKVIDALDNCIDSLDRRLEMARALRDEVAKLPDKDAFLASINDIAKKIDVQKEIAETRTLEAGHSG